VAHWDSDQAVIQPNAPCQYRHTPTEEVLQPSRSQGMSGRQRDTKAYSVEGVVQASRHNLVLDRHNHHHKHIVLHGNRGDRGAHVRVLQLHALESILSHRLGTLFFDKSSTTPLQQVPLPLFWSRRRRQSAAHAGTVDQRPPRLHIPTTSTQT
jgi:hypothetical protein